MKNIENHVDALYHVSISKRRILLHGTKYVRNFLLSKHNGRKMEPFLKQGWTSFVVCRVMSLLVAVSPQGIETFVDNHFGVRIHNGMKVVFDLVRSEML